MENSIGHSHTINDAD